MSETIEEIRVEGDNITLSLIVWRRFRQEMPGLVERALELNQGLAALGPVLPLGTIVRLPIPSPRNFMDVNAIRLWG